MSDLFAIRPAEERDLVYLQMICVEQGLGIPQTVASSTVAVNAEDIPVGFIHIENVDDESPGANGAYVYPVAVFESWQHHGVATALIKHELEKAGELKLVACTSSQDFYPRVGFEQTDWKYIARRIAIDCEACEARNSCDPIPFRMKM